MGNVYGIANPGAIVILSTAGSDTACAAGTETTVVTSGAMTGANPGDYYPVIWVSYSILLGATPATGITIAFKIGAGSDVDTFAVATAPLLANATIVGTVCLAGANSGTAWVGAGSVLNVTVNATAQAVTWKNVGSRVIFSLFRGPDA